MERGTDRERQIEHQRADLFTTSVSWGIGLALDSEGKASRAWHRWRSKRDGQPHRSHGLSGAALEQAVFSLAAIDPSLVKMVSVDPLEVDRGGSAVPVR